MTVTVLAALSTAFWPFGGLGHPARALGSTVGSNHLVVVVMENKAYSQIVGNANAPYINSTLIPAGRLFTNDYAPLHPSLPNYLVLTGGDARGCTTDSCPRDSIAGENLFHELDQSPAAVAGPAWKLYAESMPSNCYRTATGAYLPRHNPAVYFTNLDSTVGDGSCTKNDVPFTQLGADLAGGTLPQFAVVVPNRYDDMHDDRNTAPCALGNALQDTVCQGDRWLSSQLPAILSNGGRNDVTALVVWDEGTTNVGGGGQIPLIEAGPAVSAGTTDTTPLNHYGLVNAVADWLGIARLGPAVPTL